MRLNKDIDLHAPCVFEQFFQSRCSPHDFGSSGDPAAGCRKEFPLFEEELETGRLALDRLLLNETTILDRDPVLFRTSQRSGRLGKRGILLAVCRTPTALDQGIKWAPRRRPLLTYE